MNPFINGSMPRTQRVLMFIANNINQHTFDPDGVVPHLNKIFYKYFIPTGLIKSPKK